MKNPFVRRTRLDGRYNLNRAEAPLGALLKQTGVRVPAPIVSVSVGSAGMTRTGLWYRKMAALGCIDRVQSLVVYDCNSTGVRAWLNSAQQYGLEDISITPKYLPLSEGFLRQPDDYLPHAGPIERDMERIVDDMENLASRAWSRPQVILEWIGFGGHAKLSYLLHELVVERFPGAQVLPIYCLPSERVLEANIRDYRLWEEAEKVVGYGPCLITDNRAAANLALLDERVAIGLAAVESSFKFRSDGGTLAEVVSTFSLSGARWLSLDTMEMSFPVASGVRGRMTAHGDQEWTRGAVAQQIKEVIWRIAKPQNNEHHTGFFRNGDTTAEQRIFVVLPFHNELVSEIRDDVQDQLQREDFRLVYPGTAIHFGSGDARWLERTDCTFGHIVKLTGLPAEPMPMSLTRVLTADNNFRGRQRQFQTRGELLLEELKAAPAPEPEPAMAVAHRNGSESASATAAPAADDDVSSAALF